MLVFLWVHFVLNVDIYKHTHTHTNTHTYVLVSNRVAYVAIGEARPMEVCKNTHTHTPTHS